MAEDVKRVRGWRLLVTPVLIWCFVSPLVVSLVLQLKRWVSVELTETVLVGALFGLLVLLFRNVISRFKINGVDEQVVGKLDKCYKVILYFYVGWLVLMAIIRSLVVFQS